MVVGLALTAGMAPAQGEGFAWRQSSLRTETPGSSDVRRGVAMFANGEPATLFLRGAAKPPDGPDQDFSARMLMRFEDGTTFTFDMPGATQFGPDGVVPTMSASGTLVEGTGGLPASAARSSSVVAAWPSTPTATWATSSPPAAPTMH